MPFDTLQGALEGFQIFRRKKLIPADDMVGNDFLRLYIAAKGRYGNLQVLGRFADGKVCADDFAEHFLAREIFFLEGVFAEERKEAHALIRGHALHCGKEVFCSDGIVHFVFLLRFAAVA